MRKLSAKAWARSIGITEKEFNELLAKSELQQFDTVSRRWMPMKRGKEHSRSLFGRIFWDIDAHFEVMKMRGKLTREYFYCDECSAYNKIPEENIDKTRFICYRCGNETLI